MEHFPSESLVLAATQQHVAIDLDDVTALVADHAQMRDVCQKLESLAERLADGPCSQERRAAADMLSAATVDHVRSTSMTLQRWFGGRNLGSKGAVLSRILLRQIADGVHAEDVVEVLRLEILNEAESKELDRDLRCILDGYRRAIDFEAVSLLSLARDRLSPPAQATLEQLLVHCDETF